MVAEVMKMKEEHNNVSKNKWKRIIEKKGFFPAVYLTVAAILLTGVLWYQNLDNRIPETQTEQSDDLGNDAVRGEYPFDFNQDSDPVVSQAETVRLPVAEGSQSQIVTKFYDFEKDSEDQEKALVLYNNKYYQSQGIDIAASSEDPMSVVAALSGRVVELREDPLLGFVIQMEHDHGVSTYYASLTDVQVEEGQEVAQGEVLATAGQNVYGQASGTHVHFEIRKEGTPVNPEVYFDQPITEVRLPDAEDEDEDHNNDSDENETSAQNATEELQSTRATTNT